MTKEGEIFTGTYLLDDYSMKQIVLMEQVHTVLMENEHAELVSLKQVHQNGDVIRARLICINEDDEMFAEEV